MTGPRIGSMCSGYGGLDMGVMSVFGGRVVWNADPSPDAGKVLAHRYPDIPNHGDIRDTNWSRVEPVDILTAGFPCQPVSTSGKRSGTEDDRWLFDDIINAIRNMGESPRMLVFENVRGLLSANGGNAMYRVVHQMAKLGYVGRYRVVRASDIGAPHQRARVFIVGTLPDSSSQFPARCFRAGSGRRGDVETVGSGGSPTSNPDGRRWQHRFPQGKGPAADNADRRDWTTHWGRYLEAVRQWERLLGRPAPEPTEPNRNNRPALSAAFTEWLMGLPEGWVTDVPGLSRPKKIGLLGNGVVPQQAAHAVSQLTKSRKDA